MQVRLRTVRPDDLPIFFEHQCDPAAAAMAGFTPRSRPAFDDHWRRIISEPMSIVSTVEADGDVAGYVSLFTRDARREIAYWLGREHWRRGIGRQAVSSFLALNPDRPVFGSVVTGNAASLAILRRNGFVRYTDEIGRDGVREQTLRLD